MSAAERAVVVVGAGGHALVATETLRASGRHVAGWVTHDGMAAAPVADIGLSRLGDGAELTRLVAGGDHDVFVAIGNNAARAEVTRQLLRDGAVLATAVSPEAHVSPSATIAPGALVMPGAVVNALATIGAGAIVNTGASVDHECVVAEFAHLAPRSALAGNVRVGTGAFVGIGAVVTPGRSLGDWCVVGAGAAVIDDVAERTTVVGVPAHPIAPPTVVAPAVVPSATPAPTPRAPRMDRDEPEVPNILVVCTGNLCRSPLAAALLARDLEAAGVPATIHSAGTAAPHDGRPDRKMLKAAAGVGIDLAAHRSRPLTSEMTEQADLILTMSADHDAFINAFSLAAAERTVRLRRAAWRTNVVRDPNLSFNEWVARLSEQAPAAERPRRDDSDDIDDPFGGPSRAYRAMASEVADLVQFLAGRWQGR